MQFGYARVRCRYTAGDGLFCASRSGTGVACSAEVGPKGIPFLAWVLFRDRVPHRFPSCRTQPPFKFRNPRRVMDGLDVPRQFHVMAHLGRPVYRIILCNRERWLVPIGPKARRGRGSQKLRHHRAVRIPCGPYPTVLRGRECVSFGQAQSSNSNKEVYSCLTDRRGRMIKYHTILLWILYKVTSDYYAVKVEKRSNLACGHGFYDSFDLKLR